MNFFISRYAELGHDIDVEKIIFRQAIRVNTLKISEDEIVNRLSGKKVKLTKIPFAQSGYWVESDFALSSTPEYLQGYFYIQEAASQVPVQVLDPKAGDDVIDMCAAPGSKTTQISQLMENKGRIVALESNSSRLAALKNNLERCGAKNCVIYQKDAVYANDLGLKFDKILLDAPCSGNFVTDKNWLDKRTLEGVKSMARMQKSLLQTASSMLKPDGILVYSTCSLEPEEDEEVIEWALETLSLQLVDTGLKAGEPGINDKTKLCRRFWPDKEGTQGFFIAKMIKR